MLALVGLRNGVNWEALSVGTIREANSMKRAQTILEHEKIDLMICDIEMPGGSGLDLIHWVRENYPDVICIFYTCHAEFSYCQEAIKLGAVDYVVKPIPYNELEEIISKALFQVEKTRTAKNLETIWGDMTRKKDTEEESPIEKVKRIIAENISTEISREELAAQVYMSPDYLTRLFRKSTGSSLSEYIIGKRIALAKQLLENTELTMVEISEKAGFSYSTYFTRIFKKKTGMTPQQYRESLNKKV